MSDATAELHDQLAEQVELLVTGEDWVAMLAFASRFHRYSFNNCLLIMRQCPTATHVAGYRAWQALGRQVRKGECSIRILAPCSYKDKETEEKVLRGFRSAAVFDVGQTDGDPLPEDVRTCPLLEGEAPAGMWEGLADQVAEAGFNLVRADCAPANGTTNYSTHVVCVRPDLAEAQAAKTLAHELAHVRLHRADAFADGCRGRREVEAESVAYIVSVSLGLDSTTYTAPYVAGWSEGDPQVVRETAERVIRCADTILAALAARELVAA